MDNPTPQALDSPTTSLHQSFTDLNKLLGKPYKTIRQGNAFQKLILRYICFKLSIKKLPLDRDAVTLFNTAEETPKGFVSDWANTLWSERSKSQEGLLETYLKTYLLHLFKLNVETDRVLNTLLSTAGNNNEEAQEEQTQVEPDGELAADLGDLDLDDSDDGDDFDDNLDDDAGSNDEEKFCEIDVEGPDGELVVRGKAFASYEALQDHREKAHLVDEI